MGIIYRTEPSLRLIVEVWDGVITVDQWRANVAMTLADPQRPLLSITDLTTADASAITAEDQEEIAAMYVPYASEFVGVKNAAIAAGEFEPSVQFGRRVERSGLNVIVFNELRGACKWLGLDPAEIRPIIQDLRDNLRARSMS